MVGVARVVPLSIIAYFSKSGFILFFLVVGPMQQNIFMHKPKGVDPAVHPARLAVLRVSPFFRSSSCHLV